VSGGRGRGGARAGGWKGLAGSRGRAAAFQERPTRRRRRRRRARAQSSDGRLALAATRGDGKEGEDVTHNAATGAIAGLPVALDLAKAAAGGRRAAAGKLPRELEVRGEVYISKADLEAVRRGGP
jgi:hypothetical protein